MEYIKKPTNVYWDLLVILLSGTIIFSETVFFLVSTVYLLILIQKNHFKILLPKIGGLKLYIFLVVWGGVLGYYLYPIRNVARDIFYFTSTLLWILIGANFIKNKRGASLLKTLYIYAFIVSIYCFYIFLINGNFDFNGIRLNFVTGVYDIGFILPIMILNSFFNRHFVFSKKLDTLIIIIVSAHVFLSLGRISIFVPLASILLVAFLVLIYKKNRKRSFLQVFTLLVLLILLAVVTVTIIPKDVLNFFSGKVGESLNELDNSQIIDSTESAMNNWRAYEMQAAIKQWISSNFFEKIIGSGLGRGIHIDYIPYSWSEMVENNQIPLLHNGYYTVLIKIGILGVLALLTIFLSSLKKGIAGIKRRNREMNVYILLIIISFGGILYTYTIRGPVQEGAFLIWGFLMGVLNTNFYSPFKEELSYEIGSERGDIDDSKEEKTSFM